jgi:hypothetical protein
MMKCSWARLNLLLTTWVVITPMKGTGVPKEVLNRPRQADDILGYIRLFRRLADDQS